MSSAFKISFSDEQLNLLRTKLELAVFPDELENAGKKYGVPLADVKRLVALVAGFGSLNIHYVHQKSAVVDAIPLLFVHGWPGTFIEVRKLLPLLVEASPEHPSFHTVALGLPGYGFSQAPSKQGFGVAQYAEVAHKLMVALGYNEYVTQGGDWGNLITRKIALDYGGKHSKAWHSNYPAGLRPSLLKNPLLYLRHLITPYSVFEKALMKRGEWFSKAGKGYYTEQSTQPQTIGYSLADSPVGLLAWIYEKLIAWTDEYPWNDDEVLTWISLYYFSCAGPAASTRIYFEVQGELGKIYRDKPSIPMGISLFPKDLKVSPTIWYETNGNVIYRKEHASGGHFAAHERPDLLVGDLRTMFGKGGPAFGVVPGKVGY